LRKRSSSENRRVRNEWVGKVLGSYSRAGLGPSKIPGPKLYNTEKEAYNNDLIYLIINIY